MKKLSLILIIFILSYNSSFAQNYNSEPKLFITELVNDAINTLSDKSLSREEKANFIKKIALENVDISALSLYTLGELRKSSDEQTVIKYQNAFQKYFLKTLTSRLTDYSSSRFDVLKVDKKSSNYTIVSSKITPEDGIFYLHGTLEI